MFWARWMCARVHGVRTLAHQHGAAALLAMVCQRGYVIAAAVIKVQDHRLLPLHAARHSPHAAEQQQAWRATRRASSGSRQLLAP
jgi:hypothetical protein